MAPSGSKGLFAIEGVADCDRLTPGSAWIFLKFAVFDMVAAWRFETSAGYNRDRPRMGPRSLAGEVDDVCSVNE
jgi:hypothetical protein